VAPTCYVAALGPADPLLSQTSYRTASRDGRCGRAAMGSDPEVSRRQLCLFDRLEKRNAAKGSFIMDLFQGRRPGPARRHVADAPHALIGLKDIWSRSPSNRWHGRRPSAGSDAGNRYRRLHGWNGPRSSTTRRGACRGHGGVQAFNAATPVGAPGSTTATPRSDLCGRYSIPYGCHGRSRTGMGGHSLQGLSLPARSALRQN
jgi:hypothetical protein